MGHRTTAPAGVFRGLPFIAVSILLSLGAPSTHAREATAEEDQEKPSEGRPEVVLDRLEFRGEVADQKKVTAYLREVLRREARRAHWGAGRQNRIEYRFTVERLEFVHRDGVLHVTCDAVGRLPGGERARSGISFGGAPGERQVLTKRVLEVVARGVMTRLAELERRRRGLG